MLAPETLADLPMILTNSPQRWGLISRLQHWGMATLLILQWFAGEFDDAFGGSGFHVSMGIGLLLLLLLRLAWRLYAVVPEPPAQAPPWERWVARATVWAWYLLLLALPFTGLAYRHARDRDTSFFGLFNFPRLVAPDRAFAHQLEEVHEWLAWVAVALLALHLLAAFKHQLVDRDGLLKRMWSGQA